jgi:hypothetical protein
MTCGLTHFFAQISTTRHPNPPILTYLHNKTTVQVEQTTASNMSDPNKKTYSQAAGEYYNQKYEAWMPWIEDKYLSWFTKDNKASYATKRMSPLPTLSFPTHDFIRLILYHLVVTSYL